MPLGKKYQGGLPDLAPVTSATEGPAALDTLGAAFTQFNIVGSAYDRISNSGPALQPRDDYDPLGDVDGYEDQARRFIESSSPEQTQQIKNRIDRERRDQQTIRDAGGFGLAASFAAGALDPATLISLAIPVAGPATRIGQIGRLVAATTALDTASELGMQALQETRTIEQSLINVGASAVLTGIIGGAVARVPRGEFTAARDALNAELNAAGSTVGASSARTAATLEEEGIAGIGAAVAKTLGRISPLSRLLTSDAKAARQIAQDLAEVPFVLTKNEMGTATTVAVETLVKRYDATVAKFAVSFDDAYQAYRTRVIAAGQRPVKGVEFREQIAGAMRRNDQSAIPEVSALAKQARSEIIDPLTKQLQKVGLLADPVADDVARLTAQAVGKYVKAEGKQLYSDYSARVLAAAKGGAAAQGDAIGAATTRATIRTELQRAVATERQALSKQLKTLSDDLDKAEGTYKAKLAELRATLIGETKRAAIRAARTELERARKAERRGRLAERRRFLGEKKSLYTKARTQVERIKPASRKAFMKRARKGGDADPAVARMSELIRKKDAGLLDKVVTVPKSKVTGLKTVGAQSYLPRLYDVRKIIGNRTAWDDALRRYFVREGVDAAEVDTLIADVTRTITGTMRGFTDIAEGVVVKAGPLKQRTINVPDEILEPFLINDIERVLTQYVRSVAPQLEVTRRFGDLEMKQAVQNLKDEYDILMKRATNDKQKAALQKAMDDDFGDIMGIRDRLLGKLGIPANPDSVLVRSARLMRSYNYWRLLGSQLFSSLADAGRIVTKYGLPRTAKALGVLATNFKAAKLSAADAKRMAIGLDWTLNTRGATLADIGEFAETPLEVFAQKASSAFSRITGMATWNSAMKFLAASLQQDQILRTIAKGPISDRNLTKFAQLGLDAQMLKRIEQQFAKHGDDSEGLARGRSELWDDAEAALVYESAILKASDTAVLTKGVGDTPLFMSTEVGKTIFQFKSFGVAAVNRLLIPAAQGLQHGDIAMLGGLSLMLGLGVFRYAAKQWTADRPIETEPGRLMLEAIDGAGLTTYVMDGYDVFAGMTGLPRASRYTDRSWMETAAGPSAGTISDFGRTVEDLRKDGVSERDIHKIRKLLPGQNLFYIRRLINLLEGETADALGVPAQ